MNFVRRKQWSAVPSGLNLLFSICLLPEFLLTNAFSQGMQWQLFSTENSGLPDNNVLALAIDNASNLWMGTKYSGLVRFDGSTWTAFIPTAVAQHSSDSRLLFTIKPGSALPHCLERPVPDHSPLQLRHAPVPYLPETNTGPQANVFYDVAIAADDEKWIGTKFDGVFRTDGFIWTHYTQANSDLPDDHVWSLAIDQADVR